MARSNPRSSEPDDAVISPARVASERVALEQHGPPPGQRRFFIAATGVVGLAFGWAALRLPWRPDAPLALLLWVLAAANIGALVALLAQSRHLRHALSVLVVISLAAAPVFAWAIVMTGVAMVRMFGALGWGLSVALAAIGWLLLLATLPLGVLGLRLLRRSALDEPHAGA